MNFFEAAALWKSLSEQEKQKLLSLKTTAEVMAFAESIQIELKESEAKMILDYIKKYNSGR